MHGRLFLLSWFVVGCSDPPGPEPITAPQAEDLCTRSCTYDVACLADDLATCVDDCVADVGTWARHDAVATIAECRDSLGCDDDTSVCLARVEPLAFHRAFETRCREALAECPTIDIEVDCAVDYDPESDDIGSYRLMSEPVIDELVACLGQADCTTRLACIDDAFVVHGINL